MKAILAVITGRSELQMIVCTVDHMVDSVRSGKYQIISTGASCAHFQNQQLPWTKLTGSFAPVCICRFKSHEFRVLDC